MTSAPLLLALALAAQTNFGVHEPPAPKTDARPPAVIDEIVRPAPRQPQPGQIPVPVILEDCRVTAIVNGGTLGCSSGYRMQLASIQVTDGEAAIEILSDLALGQLLRCEPTGGGGGRIRRAWCWGASGDLSCVLVRRGAAVLLRGSRRCSR